MASSRDRLRAAEARGEALVIEPAHPTPAALATRSRDRIVKTLQLGFQTARAMEARVAAFLRDGREPLGAPLPA